MKIFFLIFSLVFSVSAFSGEWELDTAAESPSDVEIFTRYVDGYQMKKFKANTTIETSMASVLHALSDYSKHKEWFYKNKHSKLIRDSQGNPFMYIQINGIWPTSDRDAVMEMNITQDPVTKTMFIKSKTAPDFYPEQSDFVRMPSVESSFEIIPLAKNKTKIIFTGHADPGGSIPSWLANLYVTNIPGESLENLHEYIQKPKYKNVTWSEVKNDFADVKQFVEPQF